LVEAGTGTQFQQDIMDEVGEAHKYQHNVLPLDAGGTIQEGYAVGELSVHLHLRIRTGKAARAYCDDCAVFERADMPELRGSQLDILDCLKAEPRVCQKASGEVYRVVLVPIREAVEAEQGPPDAGILSIVRLRTLDDCEVVGVNSFGQVPPNAVGFVAGFRATGVFGEDRVGNSTGSLAVGEGELVNQMVQGGPQVVDDFSDDDAPTERRVFADLHPCDILRGLDVYFRNRFVGVSPQEPLDGVMQRLDVLVGTL
jgi:hypothetical protein